MGSLNQDGSKISQSRESVRNVGGANILSADRVESEVIRERSPEAASDDLGTNADLTTSQYSTVSLSETQKITESVDETLISREDDREDFTPDPNHQPREWVALIGGGAATPDLEAVLAEGNTGSGIVLETLEVTNVLVVDPNGATAAIFNDAVAFEEQININGSASVSDASRISFRNNAMGLQANSDGVLSLFDSGSHLRPLAAAKYLEVVTLSSGNSIELASQSGQVIIVKGTGPRTVNLQATDLYPGYIVDIKDGDGTASSGNITVAGNGNNIDGTSSFALDVNYASYTFVYNGTEWNLI